MASYPDNHRSLSGVVVVDGKSRRANGALMAREEFDAFAAVATTRLYRTAYLMLGDHHLAEDLVQDVLARLYVSWPKIQGDPHGYAYRAMANAAANHRRWAARHPEKPLPDREVGGTSVSPEDSVVLRHEVVSALRRLPAQQRVIVVLRYYLDQTETQAAQALQISVGTVKSQHSRAVTKLRSILGEELVLVHHHDPAEDPRLGSAESMPLNDGSKP
jgi:RNA polymerase sigma-70 factor (sigma-E family)